MSEAALLRVLADRLDELETLKHFPEDVTDPGIVTVAWTANSDHPGYAALSQAISDMVEQHWNALRSQVVKKKDSEVQEARKAWTQYGSAPASAPREPEVDSDEEAASAGIHGAPQQLSRVQLVQRQA